MRSDEPNENEFPPACHRHKSMFMMNTNIYWRGLESYRRGVSYHAWFGTMPRACATWLSPISLRIETHATDGST